MTTVDATVLWLRSLAARVKQLASQMTGPERLLAVVLAAWFVGCIAALPFLGNQPLWLVATGPVAIAFLVYPVIADAVIARDNMQRAYAAMVKTNATKPTGAPRVAEVYCKHGDPHRFVYGPSGWEAAGPGVIPKLEEATAP